MTCVSLTSSPRPVAYPNPCRQQAFTLIEILVVVVLLSIIGMMVMPSSGYQHNEKVRQAARLMLEDLALAQATAIGRGVEGGCAVTFHTVATPHGYQVGDASATRFGQGRAHPLGGVHFTQLTLNTPSHLQFNALGTLTPATDALITLRSGDAQLRIRVHARTGNARID